MFFFKQKTAYEMRISDWSSDVCSSDLVDEISVWHGSSLPLGGESSHGRRAVHSCRFLGVSRRRSARGLLDSHISRYGAQRQGGQPRRPRDQQDQRHQQGDAGHQRPLRQVGNRAVEIVFRLAEFVEHAPGATDGAFQCHFPRLVEGFDERSEEHTSELQSLMRISYAVFCLKKKKIKQTNELSVKHQTKRAQE